MHLSTGRNGNIHEILLIMFVRHSRCVFVSESTQLLHLEYVLKIQLYLKRSGRARDFSTKANNDKGSTSQQ
jgi:alpha-N-acetylglucosamine transferase